MRSVVGEIRKSLNPALFALSCLGVVLTCFINEGYTSASRTTYTILELFVFLDRDVMLTDVAMNSYDIWMGGIGAWTQILLPLLLSMGYLYTMSAEQQTGFKRLLLIRESKFKYSISKLLSAMISGGIIMLTGYLIFGLLVGMKFPSISEYPAEMTEWYLAKGTGDVILALKRCAGVFLYGMCINVFAYLVSLFFTDKYILLCLPLMLKYIWGQVILKIESDAIAKGNDAFLDWCWVLRQEAVMNIDSSMYWLMSFAFFMLIYLGGFGLALYLLRKNGEGIGYE